LCLVIQPLNFKIHCGGETPVEVGRLFEVQEQHRRRKSEFSRWRLPLCAGAIKGIGVDQKIDGRTVNFVKA
jgi:hypothetical protein